MEWIDVFKVTPSTAGNNDPASLEYILEDDECPLSILMNQPPGQGKRYLFLKNQRSRLLCELVGLFRIAILSRTFNILSGCSWTII